MTLRPRGRHGQRLPGPIVDGIAFLVHSNLFVSLAATSVALSTILLVDRPIDPVALFIVFAATLFVYSFNRVTDIDEDERNLPDRAAFTRRYGRLLLAAGGLLYLAAVAIAVMLGLPRVGFLGLPVGMAVLYSLFRAKRILLVKNLLVGLSWGVIPLGVGVYYDLLGTVEIRFLFAFFTVMLTVAAAVFDIKDVEGDRNAGIHTIPIAFGPRRTRAAAATVTLAVSAAVVVAVAGDVLPRRFLVLLGFSAYVLAYVPFATEDRGVLFYGFVVDGEHVFLAVLVLAVELAA